MPRDWEDQLRRWAQAPGKTEQDRMENAEAQIRAAIKSSPALAARDIVVFPQGSYRNRTTVPGDSDVDICVMLKETFFDDYYFTDTVGPKDASMRAKLRKEANVSDATYHYAEFKNDVQAALVARFGQNAVHRGDKAFDVHETTTRVDSDVLAAFEHRRYKRVSGVLIYESGTEFQSDSGKRIVNWPQQHYDNGVAKNTRTGERFKAMVRALKNLRNEMAEREIAAAEPIPSYLIECLVFNVPDAKFGSTYLQDMKNVIFVGWDATKTDADCADWVEVNDRKYLLRGGQPWTREQVHSFLHAAWNYDGLGA